MAQTETWFFPNVVHLRLRDHSLLKFAPGPREVPSDLPEAEREILKRNGAKPIAVSGKQASGEAELTASASVEVEGTQGQEETTEGLKSSPSSTQKVNKKK